jgi:hypothetical protein
MNKFKLINPFCQNINKDNNKNIKDKKETKTISNITDNFIDNKYIILSNGEKIQYMGLIDSQPYFLFSNQIYTFYLKFIQEIGFTIIYNSNDINNNIINLGCIDKLPNKNKIGITISLIDNIDNQNIFCIDDTLKIGHINSVYSKNDNILNYETSVEYSEYLLICEGIKTILCYSYTSGYSLINKNM